MNSIQLIATGRCPVCFQPSSKNPRFQLDDFSVFDCPSCSVRFIDPSLTSDQQMLIYQNSEILTQINPALEEYYEYDVLNPNSRTFKDYERALNQAETKVETKTLCEIGCGTGAFLKYAKSRGWEVSGLDSSAENIAALKNSGINAIHADIFQTNQLPQFDVVVLWDVIEHPQDPRGLLKICMRLLKPHGILLIATPCYPNLLSVLAGIFYLLTFGKWCGPIKKMYMLEHTSYFSPATLEGLLSKSGYKEVERWRTETDLKRYRFSFLTRMALNGAFFIARVLGLQNRLISISQRVI